MTRRFRSAVFAVLLSVLVPCALADIVPFNTRPVPVNPGPETPLQTILETYCPGCFDVDDDQESAGYWKMDTPPPTGFHPFLLVEYAGFAPANIVGMFAGDPVHVPIFPGDAVGGATALIDWYTGTSGWVYTKNPDNTVLVNQAFTGVPWWGFGFYLETPGNTIFYSTDALNPGGAAQVLAYRRYASNTWFLAFEDLLVGNGSDRDYNDFVMKVESIVPVPEPASILLFGAALLGVSGLIRRRRSG